jgi:hypothetical protein
MPARTNHALEASVPAVELDVSRETVP